MLALEQTQNKSAILATLQVERQLENDGGQDLPLDEHKSPFVQFLDYIKTKSSDSSAIQAGKLPERVGVSAEVVAQHPVKIGLERLISDTMSVETEAVGEAPVSLATRLQGVMSGVQHYAKVTVGNNEQLASVSRSINNATPAQVSTAVQSLQQLPAGWVQSLQNELAGQDITADEIAVSNEGSVLNALANRLKIAYPEFADKPREEIVSQLRNNLLASGQELVTGSYDNESLSVQLQASVQAMADEAGIDADVKIAFADFPKRQNADFKQAVMQSAQFEVAAKAESPEKVLPESAKVEANKAAENVKADNTLEDGAGTGERPEKQMAQNVSQANEHLAAAEVTIQHQQASEQLKNVVRNQASNVVNDANIAAEAVQQAQVRAEENVQFGMDTANAKLAEQKAENTSQDRIRDVAANLAEKPRDTEDNIDLVVTSESVTEDEMAAAQIVLSEQAAAQANETVAAKNAVENNVTSEAIERSEEAVQVANIASTQATHTVASVNAQVQVTSSSGQAVSASAGPQAAIGANSQNSQANANMANAGNTAWGANADGTTGQSASGGQSSGQQANQGNAQSNQNLGQTLAQAAQALNGNSTEQRRDIDLGMRQQAQAKAADEALQRANGLSNGSLDAVSAERRANLPPSMQSIPLPVRHPQWGQALGQRVNYMINSQVQQAQITLNPEKLGPIQIKLQFDRDQQVQISVLAQHGMTRDAIDASIPRLREMLEQQGINLASVDVETGKSFADQQAQQDEDVNMTAMGATDGNGGATVEEEQSMTTVASDSLVDYYA